MPAPPPPRDLDAASRTLWSATRKSLQEQGTWEDSDAPLLERYIRSLAQVRQCRDERNGALTSDGYKGQPVAHPLLRVEREATRDANEYARELLLTPKARRQAELEGKKPQGAPKFGL